MEHIKSLGRLTIAALLVLALISGAFLGTTSTVVYAEGGGNGPMPTGDTVIPADGAAVDPGTGSEELITLSTILFVVQNVL
ncbi:hypothetical protein ACFLQW_00590 [Candidatus Zixiibacteriota bacterium]